ncbi:MAG: dihydrodipicolinate synthase family protein, partial [Bryobacteraceae bacterium]|nr:dihydrodipicolinate synthase family protein [Bryobacteraceae bacterium]
QAAGASGAAGVLLMPPYFYRYSREEIRTFYEKFAANTDLSIPILVYNIPQFGNPVPADLSLEMLTAGIVHGVKDSAPSADGLRMLSRARQSQPFPLFVGNDSLFIEAFGWGVSGAISGVASAVPELLVALGKALTSGSKERVSTFAARLHEFISWIEKFPVPVGIREATCLRGLPLGPNASPASPEAKLLLEEFREWFRPWLKAVVAETRIA